MTPTPSRCPTQAERATAAANGNYAPGTRKPSLTAYAHGASARLASGVSFWCGLHEDVFDPVTLKEPLVVHPGEEVTIPNPLPGMPLVSESVVQTRAAGPPVEHDTYYVWPHLAAPYRPSGRPDLVGDELRFNAEDEPGRYVVFVYLRYGPREDAFASADRDATWALLMDVAAP